MTDALRTFGLTKRYGSKTAVRDLSLAVERGEIYAFLGLNGAGKTTTIRMLLGTLHPSAGSAEILGVRVSAGAHALWSRVGYLVETPRAYPELSVRENLEIARRLHRLGDRRAVDRALDRFGLAHSADTRAGNLSLGNLQRLGLARAALHGPELLILDELANALDPAGVVEVRELLRQFATESGVTVFFSSHILGEVARLATRVGIIHAGALVEELSMAELERRCERRLVVDACDRQVAQRVLADSGVTVRIAPSGLLETTDAHVLDHPEYVSALLARHGAPPSRLCIEQEDLESHFLRLVSAAGVGA